MIVRTILRALWAATVLILAVTLALGVLFVIGYNAVAVLGTKSNGTFQYVALMTPRTRQPLQPG